MILHKHCKVCNKTAEQVSTRTIAGIKFVSLKCGHTITEKVLKTSDLEITSEDGFKPYPYQIDGAKFGIEEAGGRVLIADEMGLGKTVQSLMIVKKMNWKTLFVVKSGLRMQWLKENMRWLGIEYMPQIIEKEKQFLLPGKGYIISIDLLWRFKELEKWIDELKVDAIVIDECQTVKNHDSKRTNCLRKLCDKVKYIIALSGTPIKNHAGEYFPILNMLRPEKFPSLVNFQRQWVDAYFDARSGKYKYGGIKNIDRFTEYTKDFIIRRSRKDVNDQIKLACGTEPKRMWRFSELGKSVEAMYQLTMNEFTNYYMYSNDSAFQRGSNILAYMSKMRHLTGLAKVEPVLNYIQDFIVENEYTRKICIFLHHKDVAGLIRDGLEKIRQDWPAEFGESIAEIKSEDDMMRRNNQIEMFKSDKCRILIASTLASSEGLNLQFCSDFCFMERQWNPANEEQAEARFIRIGQEAEVVNGTYFVATGTIDEFFSELVEKKRAIMKNTLDKENIKWEESSLMKELAELLASQNMKKWKL